MNDEEIKNLIGQLKAISLFRPDLMEAKWQKGYEEGASMAIRMLQDYIKGELK